MGRHSCCAKQKLRKGLWSPEEDEKLYNYITRNGVGCWSSVAKQAGLQRCGKSCRLRWINYLRPDLKRGMFSQHEEDLIINLHKMLGNRWAQIAAQLPGRTDNEIKNFWNSCLKKKLTKQGIEPKTHKPLVQGGGGADDDHQKNITSTTIAPAHVTGTAKYSNNQLYQYSINGREQAPGAAGLVGLPVKTTTSPIKTEFNPTGYSYYNSSSNIDLIQCSGAAGQSYFSTPVFDTTTTGTAPTTTSSSSVFDFQQMGFDSLNTSSNIFLSGQYQQQQNFHDHQLQAVHFDHQGTAGALVSSDHLNHYHELNLPNLTNASTSYLCESTTDFSDSPTRGGGSINSFLFNDQAKESSTSTTSTNTTTTSNLDSAAVFPWDNKLAMENLLEYGHNEDGDHSKAPEGIKVKEDVNQKSSSPWQQTELLQYYGNDDDDQFRSSYPNPKSFPEELGTWNVDLFQQI